jgi:hypothetical protein
LYAGWIEADGGDSKINEKAIWAVGSEKGIKAFYDPYYIQNQDGNKGTQSSMLKATDLSPTSGDPADGGNAYSDSVGDNADNSQEIADLTADSKKWGKLISGVTVQQVADTAPTNP